MPAKVLASAQAILEVSAEFLLGGDPGTAIEKEVEELANFIGQLPSRLVVDDAMVRRLIAARVSAGFDSASAAARNFGWAISTYSAHESRRKKPHFDQLIGYALAFTTDPYSLLGVNRYSDEAMREPADTGAGRHELPARDEISPKGPFPSSYFEESASIVPVSAVLPVSWVRSKAAGAEYVVDLFSLGASQLVRRTDVLVLPVSMLEKHLVHGKVLGLRVDSRAGRIDLYLCPNDRPSPGMVAYDGNEVFRISEGISAAKDPTAVVSRARPALLGLRVGEISID